MFSEIINPFLNVRNKIKDTNGNWIDLVKPRENQYTKRASRLPVNSQIEEVVFEVWNKRIIIDTLSFASNTNAYPVLWIREGETNVGNEELLRTLTMTGGASAPFPDVIEFQGHPLLEIGNKDESGATVYLKRPIILSNGGKLIFTGSSSSNGEMSYHVNWREVKEDANV